MPTLPTRTPLLIATALTAALAAQTPQHLVVPAAYGTNDAVSYAWLPGASREVRQQTLVGAGHLTPLLGRTLQAIELRRTAENEVFAGGTANLTVTLSIAPHTALEGSSTFAANVGGSPLQVYSGPVTFPTSPATPPPSPTTAVAWTANNTVRIAFSQPFVYPGGTLCIDITGQPISGQNANWWMADAEFEDISGTVQNLGGGCGIYGGPSHEWAYVSPRSLLPGGYAHFQAYGTPWGIGIAAFGQRSPVGVPLSLLGLNAAPGCDAFLATIDAVMGTVFVPPTVPALAASGGDAHIEFKIPASTSMFGLSLTTQWLDWTQIASSNAIEWTIASAMPTLDMALIDGHPSEAQGNISVHLAHVLRFEYQ
jgi:hypothetical protein